MPIFAMHGVVRGVEPHTFAHRNMIDEARFVQHLTARAPYVSVERALQGDGDALTIDDATAGAARAAALARQYGHDVELFINPYHVAHRAPYFFAILDAALDDSPRATWSLNGDHHDLTTPRGRRRVRRALKHLILGHDTEDRRLALTQTLAADLLEGRPLSIRPHLATLSIDEVRALIDQGVTIGNHGWTHGHPSRLDSEACEHEIRSGAAWIAAHLGVASTNFAVPFGDFVPDWRTSPWYRLYLLCTDVLHDGMVGTQIANRVTLRL